MLGSLVRKRLRPPFHFEKLICNLQKVSPAEELREDWTRIPLSPWAQNMWSSLWKLCTLYIYGAYILYAVHIPLRILISQKSVPSPSVCNCPDFFDKHFANTPKGKTVRSYQSLMILQFYDIKHCNWITLRGIQQSCDVLAIMMIPTYKDSDFMRNMGWIWSGYMQ